MTTLVAPPKIELTPQELHHAAHLGLTRQYQAMVRGNRDSVWEKPYHESLSAHVVGAMGEMAVAKYMGMWFSFGEGTYKIYSDLANDIEVRTRTNGEWSLLVRPNDSDTSIFVCCVIGSSAGEVVIHGWIEGKEAKKEEWSKDWGNRGRPVYSVPKESLAHISELRNRYRD